MPSRTALIHPAPLPLNARPHLRVELRLAGHLVPYLHPSVVITNRAGWRL
ncbi:MAG: hypothetical protein J7513_09145 [Solirubrobacteraceae bacterium]|nr:hypothetical protein [Solirubrobacteraceae bacterium]